MLTVNELRAEFQAVLGVEAPASARLLKAAEGLLDELSCEAPLPAASRAVRLRALVNAKFDVNGTRLAELYATAAGLGITFNYHQKVRLAEAFNHHDPDAFNEVMASKGGSAEALIDRFDPAPPRETLERLHRELATPTLVRKDSKPRDWSSEIKAALFGGFVFQSFPTPVVHRHLDPDARHGGYEPDFWKHLHRSRPHLFSRARSAVYVRLRPDVDLDRVAARVRQEFADISNHGHLAIHLAGWGSAAWRAAAHLTLFAEKMSEVKIGNGYFRPSAIEKSTRDYIPLDPVGDYKFGLAHIGFHYKDTFVFGGGQASDLLLLFQKNVADETLIPCPTCRSHEVQGNSYSSLGVKSWECNNPLCPDRSKFNRGKRYSFLQLLKQEAIEDDFSQIPVKSVRSWGKDVQPSEAVADILPMIIRHYTLAGDGVAAVGTVDVPSLGRDLKVLSVEEYLAPGEVGEPIERELSSAYFSRFLVRRAGEPLKEFRQARIGSAALAIHGDSEKVLRTLREESVDGAVTSPPYYNAREYSQWDNVYCYMYDMYNNAAEVFRVLKPGGYYLFNIFDYFDNENNIALSAMGDKRMILSAYCVRAFEECGFRTVGNVVWDKGEIEGKRAFNGGNFSPYYQAPLNCWEHILVFRKPGAQVELTESLPDFLRAKPVIKMVRGENRHGHTAPFPEAVPNLLLERLPHGSIVLDPYGGSMTTARAAERSGHASICIEQDPHYFDLGVRLIGEATRQFHLV